MISKSGNSSGTYARSEIAFEFASWLSPEFKLYLITEFERLKRAESYQSKAQWQAQRILTKVNYSLHTDSIKKSIVPNLTDKQKNYIYAEEADVLNVALFGMTAKEWRTNNPELPQNGNIRDYTDLLHLIILSNPETLNANLIANKMSQKERLIILNKTAKTQFELLQNNKNIKKMKLLEKD